MDVAPIVTVESRGRLLILVLCRVYHPTLSPWLQLLLEHTSLFLLGERTVAGEMKKTVGHRGRQMGCRQGFDGLPVAIVEVAVLERWTHTTSMYPLACGSRRDDEALVQGRRARQPLHFLFSALSAGY